MYYENYFKDLLESVPDYRKIVLLLFLFKNDVDSLVAPALSENDINRLSLDYKNILREQHEEYLDFIKNEEESVTEKFLIK